MGSIVCVVDALTILDVLLVTAVVYVFCLCFIFVMAGALIGRTSVCMAAVAFLFYGFSKSVCAMARCTLHA